MHETDIARAVKAAAEVDLLRDIFGPEVTAQIAVAALEHMENAEGLPLEDLVAAEKAYLRDQMFGPDAEVAGDA